MKKFNLRNIVSSLFVLFTLTLVIFVVENSFIIPSLVVKSFEITYFVIFAVFAISLIVFYIMYSLQDNNYKRVYLIVGIVSAILLINLVIVFLLPDDFVFSYKNRNDELTEITIEIKQDYRLRSVLLTALTFVFLLMFLIVYPRKKHARNTFIAIIIFYLILCYILIGYSLIKEFPIYRKTITLGVANRGGETRSLFVNRNLFASYLFVGLLFCVYLSSIMKKHRYVPILVSLPIAVIIFFTYSKTKIVLSAFVYIAYALAIIILNFKKHPVIITALLLAFIGFMTSAVLLRVMPVHSETDLGILLRKIFPDYLFAGDTFNARVTYWKVGLAALKSNWWTYVFGEGFYISRMILGEASAALGYAVPSMPYGNYHNGYVELWANVGIIGLVAYLVFLIYMVYIYIRIFKYHKLFSLYSFIALGALLIHSSVEAITPFLFNSEGIIHALPVFMPQLIYYYRIKEAEVQAGGKHNITNEPVLP